MSMALSGLTAPGLWSDTLAASRRVYDPLTGATTADVAIVGAGFTGLWTAYYLVRADPSLRVVVLEAETVGFGASGRNGGWCSALFAASRQKVAERYGRPASLALHGEMQRTVDEVGRVAAAEGIDAQFVKGGTLTLATRPEHVSSIQDHVAHGREWGALEADEYWLTAEQAAARVASTPCLGAAFTPHCARVHPGRLVQGLADVVADAGVQVHERTRVEQLLPRRVRTARGDVTADVVVRATEGFTATLPGHGRALAPVYSLMIATEPLPDAFWDEVGWRLGETVTDGRNLLIYAQRTADDRIALGGRGAPYHAGSRIRPSYDLEPGIFAKLEQTLVGLFPAARGARITHRWGGPLGVPRDWFSSVGLDAGTGAAWAGGYVGDGVSTSNLAGRTLADLILRRDTELVHLPWVGHRSPSWEPEPLRWLGVNAVTALMTTADWSERRTGHPSRLASAFWSAIGQ